MPIAPEKPGDFVTGGEVVTNGGVIVGTSDTVEETAAPATGWLMTIWLPGTGLPALSSSTSCRTVTGPVADAGTVPLTVR